MTSLETHDIVRSLDCSSCYYPNDEGAQFCVRCAAALGVPATHIPDKDDPSLAYAGSFGDALSPSAFDAMPGPGSILSGKYRLLRALGSGGFGSVYEAEQLPLGLRVAIKLLNQASLQDAKVRERFLTEARMVAQLRSPHVVVLQDFAVTPQGIPYLVMELLRGEDLGRALCRGVLPARRTLRIVTQVCEALGEAHAAGIVHRDVKPENVVLIPRPGPVNLGNLANLPAARRAQDAGSLGSYDEADADSNADFVKMVDFGVAKFVNTQARASAVLGTPAYVAPEMLAGEPLDGRSDLYAVGIMLWESITGRLPFPGKNQAEMMNSHLYAPRLRPREIDPKLVLPEALEDLMVALVARDPTRRPRTAYELRAQLLPLIPLCPARAFPNIPPPNGGPPWDPPPAS